MTTFRTHAEQYGKIQNSTRSNKCPICGGVGCGLVESGNIVLCWRRSEGAVKQTRIGTWVHVIESSNPRPVYRASIRPRMVSPHTHTAYIAFLKALVLRDKHYNHLSKVRRLTDETI